MSGINENITRETELIKKNQIGILEIKLLLNEIKI